MQCSKRMEGVIVGEIYDMRHDPVFNRMPLKADQGTLKPGQCVKINTDGTVQAAATSDEMYGVALETVDSTTGKDTFVNVLVHGVVKKNKLMVGSGEPAVADFISLKKAGIFALD